MLATATNHSPLRANILVHEVGDELLFLLFRITFLSLDIDSAWSLATCEGVDVELHGHLGTLGKLESLFLFFLRFLVLLLVFVLLLALIFAFLGCLIVGVLLFGVNVFSFGLKCIVIYPNDGCISLTKVVTVGWHPCCLLG